jgi:hypothetical protein
MICPVQLARDMSAFRAARVGEDAEHVLLHEGRDGAGLEELVRQGVCTRRAEGVIEIRDRFWPYQRKYDSAASEESCRYVAEVRRLFLERRCVQSNFTAADDKLALSLFRRGIPLMRARWTKLGDANGRQSWESSLLSDPDAKISIENWRKHANDQKRRRNNDESDELASA